MQFSDGVFEISDEHDKGRHGGFDALLDRREALARLWLGAIVAFAAAMLPAPGRQAFAHGGSGGGGSGGGGSGGGGSGSGGGSGGGSIDDDAYDPPSDETGDDAANEDPDGLGDKD